MPVIDGSCIDATDITTASAGLLQSALILTNPIAISLSIDRSQSLTETLIGVYLPEHIEIALVTSLQGLICLFVAKHFCCTLQDIRTAVENLLSYYLPLLNMSFWQYEVNSSDHLDLGP